MSEHSASYPLHPTHTSMQDMLENTQPELTQTEQTKQKTKPAIKKSTKANKQM